MTKLIELKKKREGERLEEVSYGEFFRINDNLYVKCQHDVHESLCLEFEDDHGIIAGTQARVLNSTKVIPVKITSIVAEDMV